MARTYIKGTTQPRTRGFVAQAAWNRNGGSMGGSRKAQVKRGRQDVRQALKRGDYA